MHSNSSNILVAFLTLVTLVALTGFQVTSETSSSRLLGRLGAAMVELDRWLPAHREEIKLLARDRPNQPLTLSELPVDITIPSSVALDASTPVLKAAITEAMGLSLYDSGYEAIQDEQGETHLGFMEPLRWSISNLDSGAHGFWRLALAASGLALVVMCAVQFWGRQSPMAGFTVGAGVASILALLLWLLVSFLGSSVQGALDREIASVAVDGIWIGLRNGLAATAIGLGGIYVYNSFIGPRPRDDWDEWDEYDYEGYDSEPRATTPPY